MAGIIDFVPFADDPGADVITQPAYVALPARTAGFSTGVAESSQLNKVWRQSSVISAALAQYINAQTGDDVLDDGNVTAIVDTIAKAIQNVVSASNTGVNGNFSGLRVEVTAGKTLSASFSGGFVQNAAGNFLSLQNASFGINAAVNGVNGLDTGTLANSTWYYHFVIYNPTTQTIAGLLSASATAPTLPTGYTYWARMGSVRCPAASTGFIATLQTGKRTVHVLGGPNLSSLRQMATGPAGSISGTSVTWVAVALGIYVPPTATRISIMVSGTYTGGSNTALVAPNNNYSGFQTALSPLVGVDNTGAINRSVSELTLESTNIYWAAGGGSCALFCYGWYED